MSSRNNNISFPSRSNIANLFPVRSVKISIFRSFSVPQRRRERLPSLPVLFIFGWSDVTPVPSSPNLKSFRSRTNAHFWFASHTTSARTISIPLTGHVIPVSRPVLISRSSRPVLSRPIRTLGKYLSPSVKMSFSRFCGLQAAHRPTLAGLLLSSCLIVVSLWMVCETAAQHAGRRRLPVQSRLY